MPPTSTEKPTAPAKRVYRNVSGNAQTFKPLNVATPISLIPGENVTLTPEQAEDFLYFLTPNDENPVPRAQL